MYPSENTEGNDINNTVLEMSPEVENQFMAKLWK